MERRRCAGYTTAELSVGAAIGGLLFVVAGGIVASTAQGNERIARDNQSRKDERAAVRALRTAVETSGWDNMSISATPFGHYLKLQSVLRHTGGVTQWGTLVEPAGRLVRASRVLPGCSIPVLAGLSLHAASGAVDRGGVFTALRQQADALLDAADSEADADVAAGLREEAEFATAKAGWTTVFTVLDGVLRGKPYRAFFRLVIGPGGNVLALELLAPNVDRFEVVRAGNSCELTFHRGDARRSFLLTPRNGPK